VLGLEASDQCTGPSEQEQGPFNFNFNGSALSPFPAAAPWVPALAPGELRCVLFPAPQGTRGGRARGRRWTWGTTSYQLTANRGRARPPRGLFGERGLGRGGG
jgi:hypothetical protein